jgi:hypothetical protein
MGTPEKTPKGTQEKVIEAMTREDMSTLGGESIGATIIAGLGTYLIVDGGGKIKERIDHEGTQTIVGTEEKNPSTTGREIAEVGLGTTFLLATLLAMNGIRKKIRGWAMAANKEILGVKKK